MPVEEGTGDRVETVVEARDGHVWRLCLLEVGRERAVVSFGTSACPAVSWSWRC